MAKNQTAQKAKASKSGVKRIYIFDTTLRDGEQSPGATMTPDEKVQVAEQLEKLNVDVIEAGFPAASQGEIEAIQKISQKLKRATMATLARMRKEDIDAAVEALKYAKKKRLHVFLATSPIHREFKLKMSREEILETIRKMVKYARKHFDEVEFSPEDASRTELDFLTETVKAAVESGAASINIPDTVGYMVPEQFGAMIRHLVQEIPVLGKQVILRSDLAVTNFVFRPRVVEGVRRDTGNVRSNDHRLGTDG